MPQICKDFGKNSGLVLAHKKIINSHSGSMPGWSCFLPASAHGCMCVTLNGNARGKSELSPVLLVPE